MTADERLMAICGFVAGQVLLACIVASGLMIGRFHASFLAMCAGGAVYLCLIVQTIRIKESVQRDIATVLMLASVIIGAIALACLIL